MLTTLTVAEHERALLIRDGRLERVLEPGRHRIVHFGQRIALPRFDVRQPSFTSEWARVMEKNHPELAARHLEIVRTGADEAALITLEGQPWHVMGPNQAAYFWKVLRDISVVRVDLTAAHRIERKLYQAWKQVWGQSAYAVEVPDSHTALLFVDGELRERLAPGLHVFWAIGRTVRAQVYDLRPETIEVAAQEILTRDRVSLRLTLTAFARVIDPEKLAQSTPDHVAYVYRLVQFAAREAVGGRTLDQLLNDRVKVDAEIGEQVRAKLGDIGLEIGELRVKDVILPGDMRELLNKVVEAEKLAQANLIRRQEETAATRSLLNTARLMDDNPTLMRLKELEALEKVTEKIGRIDIHAGRGAAMDSLLDGLVSLAGRSKEKEE